MFICIIESKVSPRVSFKQEVHAYVCACLFDSLKLYFHSGDG